MSRSEQRHPELPVRVAVQNVRTDFQTSSLPCRETLVRYNVVPTGKKFYAVRVGHQTGVFPSYEESRKHHEGCKGAQHKSFKTLKDAWDYVLGSA